MATEEETKDIEIASEIDEEMPPPPTSPPAGSKGYSGVGFALALVAGILILIGAVVALALGPLMAAIIPWAEIDAEGQAILGMVGAFMMVLAIIGVIFGIIIIIVDILMVQKGKKVPGGVIILVLSVISLAGGGGFFIGAILGIIGAILILIYK